MNKQFKEWYQDKYSHGEIVIIPSIFKRLDFSLQWGVYLCFFDSVGIDVGCFLDDAIFDSYYWYVGDKPDGNKPSRKEAQQEAIKKAFEILEQ